MNAQRTITGKYLMSNNADHWTKTYSPITKRGITKENQYYAPQHLVRNITEQMIEYYTHCDNKIQELSKNINNTTRELDKISNISLSMGKELEFKKENLKKIQNEVESQKQHAKKLQYQVDLHKQEALYYALSRSWNITRPLRKITGFIKGKKND